MEKPESDHDKTIPERGEEWEALRQTIEVKKLSQETPVCDKPEEPCRATEKIDIPLEDGELGAGNLHFRGDLVLNHYETQTEFRILNKDLNIPIILGRPDVTTGFAPHIDLTQVDEDQKTVSRRHATISPRGDVLVLTDHNSVNGTYLNSQRLVPEQGRVLRNGDMLRLGRVCLILYFVQDKEKGVPSSDTPSKP